MRDSIKIFWEIKNPKRRQRNISKQMSAGWSGTKAQQAAKLQQETRNEERKERSKIQKEERKQFQFELRKKKRKEKHKGH